MKLYSILLPIVSLFTTIIMIILSIKLGYEKSYYYIRNAFYFYYLIIGFKVK